MDRPEPKFEVGQLVHFKNEDKTSKPHQITDIRWVKPFHKGEEGFYLYSLDEGCYEGRDETIIHYIDKYLLNKVCEWLKENIYHRVYECGDRLGFPTADFIKDFRKAMEE